MNPGDLPPHLGESSAHWERQILHEWDDPKQLFPAIPPVDLGYARARMTAFRSSKEWLTVFELIGFDYEAGVCLDEVRAFGNKVKRDRQAFADAELLTPPRESVHFPFFSTDQAGRTLIDPLDFTVEIRAHVRHFTLTPGDYSALGIDLQMDESESVDPLVKILRLLTYSIPEELFLDDSLLLTRLGRPPVLPRFLRLYDWRHPDYRRGERPSESICLRSLAAAIGAGNPKLYKCPHELMNTHWSLWAEWPG